MIYRIKKNSKFKGVHAIVTAGPTIEELDPVRYLSNRSSGKMGYALAESLSKRGAKVTLISGPTHLDAPKNVELIPIESAQQMFEAVKLRFDSTDIVFKSAAVSDYAPAEMLDHKLKKQAGDLTVTFKRTPDILKYLGENKHKQFLVGFAAETQNIETYAQKKIKKVKNVDVIIANNVGDRTIGFSSDDNAYTMYYKNGKAVELGKHKKSRISGAYIGQFRNKVAIK